MTRGKNAGLASLLTPSPSRVLDDDRSLAIPGDESTRNCASPCLTPFLSLSGPAPLLLRHHFCLFLHLLAACTEHTALLWERMQRLRPCRLQQPAASVFVLLVQILTQLTYSFDAAVAALNLQVNF